MTQPWQMHDVGNPQESQPGADNGMNQEIQAAPRKPKANNAFVLLLVVFCGALAMIYLIGMRKPKAAVAADTQTEEQFDTALASLAQRSGQGALNKQTNADQIVQMFYNAPKASQIKVEQLPSNPFDLELGEAPVLKNGKDDNAAPAARTVTATAQETADKPGFRLQSIIVSRQMPAAMINNRLCTQGSRIGEWEVASIDAKRVVLSNKGRTIELTLDQPNLKNENAE